MEKLVESLTRAHDSPWGSSPARSCTLRSRSRTGRSRPSAPAAPPAAVVDYVPADHLAQFVVALAREHLDLSEIVASYKSGLGQELRHRRDKLVPLQTLRERAQSAGGTSGRLKVSVVTGDVRQMHQASEYSGALFQVASQFNALEMTSFAVTPEHGVTRYMHDRAQGPGCAIAA